MDWSKPVAKRTRQSEALYYKELHKRIKLGRPSGGGSLDGRLELECGSEGQGSVVGGSLKECSVSGGSEIGRKGCQRTGMVETIDSDGVVVVVVGCEERSVDKVDGVVVEEDSVVFVGVEDRGDVVDDDGSMVTLSNRMISGSEMKEEKERDAVSLVEETTSASDDDVAVVGCDERRVDASVDSDSVVFLGTNDSGSEAELVDGGGDMETSCQRMLSDMKMEEHVALINDDDVNDESDGASLMADAKMEEDDDGALISYQEENEDRETAADVDSGRLSCSDCKVNESNEEVEYDGNDDDGCDFSERLRRKVEYSNVLLETGKWIWNDNQGINGWIAYFTGVNYVLDSGYEESMDGISVLNIGTAEGDTQQNFSTMKNDVKVQNNAHNNLMESLENNSLDFNTTSKSYSKSKKIKGGNLNQPFEVAEEDNDDGYIPKRMSKRWKLGISTNLEKNCAQKYSNILQNLVDSMLNDNDGPLEELASQQTTVPAITKEPLPLKFTFGVPKTSPPQKTEIEKELDKLWDEFDLARSESDISSTAVNKVDQTAYSTPERATKLMPPYCHNGQHVFATDDEIGIKCKHCSFVKLEIRHLMPCFSKYPYRRSEKKYAQDEDEYVGFNEIPFEDVGCNSDSDCGRRICAKGTVWDLIPEIREGMHPHQQEGFEFIWKNIAGGINLSELLKRTCFDSGNGCIISHAPGTGKSRLTIVFLQTYMKLYPECRPVIIAPRSMLLSWEAELRKWKVDIPFHNLNLPVLSGKENAAAINFLGQANHDNSSMRLLKLFSWKKDGGILGLSYKLYECLAGEKSVARKRKRSRKNCNYDQEFREILLETPNLLVLDEGHTPRNERSLIWQALSKIKTEKRIILSGTPFQNNFVELFNTLCLVRPKFADSIQPCKVMGRSRLWRVSAAKGKWFNLTSSIGKFDQGNVRLEELRCMLDSFVHIYKGTILQKSLPGLRDSIIVLRPAEFQKRILEGVYNVENCLRRNHVASLVSLHPSLLPESEWVHFPRDKYKFERLRLNPEAGVKTKFLIELIRLSEATKEKVLVFSEFIDPLNFIRDLLKSYFGWAEGEEILYMDGGIDVMQRQSSINTFNDLSSGARVLLASKRACSEGINLVGASRVVLLDVVWNPSVERQAISRAYRLGQKRVVHVYQLITGTLEWDKYCLQSKKSWLSELLFSSTDKDENGNFISNAVSGDNILEAMVHHSSFKDMLEKIIHQPKESLLNETFGVVDEECTF